MKKSEELEKKTIYQGSIVSFGKIFSYVVVSKNGQNVLNLQKFTNTSDFVLNPFFLLGFAFLFFLFQLLKN